MANNPEAELRTLNHKRGLIKARVTRFATFAESVNNEQDVVQLKLRLSKLEPCWQEFEDIQAQIEILDLDNAPQQEIERETFENSYFSVIALAESSIKRFSTNDNIQGDGNSQPVNGLDNLTQVKLPTINLPTFDGAYDQWMPFVDTFQSLIHDNEGISHIQKFHYLRSSLSGDAAQVIHSLEISSINYNVAWELLKQRYENKRIIIQNHVKALFEMPVITKESHSALRQLFDTTLRHLRALKTLDQPTEAWDTLVIHIVTSKFDSTTKREWESIVNTKDLPIMADLNKFLQHRCQLLEALDTNNTNIRVKQQQSFNASKPRTGAKAFHSKGQTPSQAYVSSYKPTCPKCKQSHYIYHCEDFLKLTIGDRFEEIKKMGLCLNCLKPGHQTYQCNSRSCRTCSRKHNTLLHFNNTDEIATQLPHKTITNHSAQAIQEFHILLSTAIIEVYDKDGKLHQCRVLLDSGSQSNFITEELCQKLQLNVKEINLPVTGINQSVTPITKSTRTTIKSRYNAFKAHLTFLVLSEITERLPLISMNILQWNIPNNIKLADPGFNMPNKIDMLLGAEIFWSLLCIGQIQTSKNLPILQKTHLGWIVSGKVMSGNIQGPNTSSCHLTRNQSLDQQLTKFWQLEEPTTIIRHSSEEIACEEHFKSTVTRDGEGRFVVKLPLKPNHNLLGDSKQIALKRFHYLERKLDKNVQLKKDYSAFINEYRQLGHMERVQEPDENSVGKICYLPHHAVFKETSLTTKLRVLFDGSSQTSSGISLNEVLMIGPTIQEDLFSIVLRFRTHKYVLTADIAKMYRQVRVDPTDADLQRIIWREDSAHPIETYRLNTVTYGTASAPFLATRCLQQLAFDESSEFPTATLVVLRDFYIDDLLTGTDSLQDAKALRTDLTQLLAKGGFELRKWNSNNSDLLDPNNTNDQFSLQLAKAENVKTLGLLWNSGNDKLQYEVKSHDYKERLTKRRILGTIAEIFDPLGLLGPIIITAKIIIQKLWQLNLEWDETIPMVLHTEWKQYEADLQTINQLRIPRRVITGDGSTDLQLHGFCDASEAAYGACIYLRATDQYGNNTVHLLCAKSRVAPLKTVSIPRLELCAAVLLAQLARRVVTALHKEPSTQYFWTDSTITLAWIKSSPHQWKTFVANRSAEIQDLTSIASWRHVRTLENPADIISRGIPATCLANNHLWWHGPAWLTKNSKDWPSDLPVSQPQADFPEVRKLTTTLMTTEGDSQFVHKYSSLSKLIRVVAYCLRFKHNCLHRQESQVGPIQVHEHHYALTCLIKGAQEENFKSEIQALKMSKPVLNTSKLLSLSPFIDENYILRVGGRLRNANISSDQRFPIILPSKHKLTILIINREHTKQLHTGIQATLASIRLKYWPISGYKTVKSVLSTCVRCTKAKPTMLQPKMGDLPTYRSNPSRSFSTCGIDYCGPFHIKDGGHRSKKTVKHT